MPRTKRRYLDDTPVDVDVSQYINNPFTVNGITYATVPSRYTKGKIANSITKEDANASNVYIKQGVDGKWYQTRMDKDAANINYHLNQRDIVNRSNEIIDNQWRQGDGETIRVNQGDARARQQWFSNEDATKFLLTTAGLGALGGGIISAPLATTLGLVGGYAGGKAVDKGMQLSTGKNWGEWMSDKTGLPEWFSEYTNPGTIIGGSLAGFGSADIARTYANPNSLLNKNIRTAIFNQKPPLGYDLRDPNNLIPFIKGVGYSLIGKPIRQNSHLKSTYNNISKFIKMAGLPYNISKPKAGQSVIDYIYNLPEGLRDIGIMGSNRAIAFDKYLGLDSYKDTPLLYKTDKFYDSKIKHTSYIKGKNGEYNVKLDKETAYPYLKDIRPNSKTNEAIDTDGNFIGYDYIIHNHGGMNGRLVQGEFPQTYNVVANDIFDIMPFHRLNTLKYYDKIPKSIRNFEVSKIIPGAKPFKVNFDFGKNIEYPAFLRQIKKDANFLDLKDWFNSMIIENNNRYQGNI